MNKIATETKSFQYFHWATRIYLIGILLGASLAYSDDVLDRTLLPRFAIAFTCIIAVCLLLLLEKKMIKWPTISFPLMLLGAFCLWNMQSLFWVDTFSEALFESQRVFLFWMAFGLSLVFLHNDAEFEKKILQLATILGAIALLVACYQLLQIDHLTKLSLYEVKGISGHRNLFGALMFLLLGFTLLGSIQMVGGWKKIAGGVTFGLLVMLLVLQARSAWMGLLVALIFGGGLFRWTKYVGKGLSFKLIYGAVAALVLTVVWYSWQGGLEAFFERVNLANYLKSETAIERLRLWDKTLCTFWQSPWVGVGAGNWQTHFAGCDVHGLYSIEMHNVTYQRPHNDFLWILSENGIIGSLLYFSFLGSILYTALSCFTKVKTTQQRQTLQILIPTMIGFWVIAFFSFPKERIELILWSAILYALVFFQVSREKRVSTSSAKFPKILLVLCLLASVFAVFSSWKRGVGEYEMNQIYFLKAAQKWPELIDAAQQGGSPFYQLDPNSIPLNWYEGTARFARGEYDLAKSHFEKALQLAPYSQHAWNDLGSTFEKLGKREQAIQCYYKALEISPLFDDPKLNLGILHFKNGDYIQSKDLINQLRDTLRAKPYLQTVEAAIQQNSK